MADIRGRTCCFTGHREIPEADRGAILAQAEAAIRALYRDTGVQCFCVGGAVGFDTMMAELLFRLRESDLHDIKVILVYPCDGFTSRWSEAQKEKYAELYPKYDEVVRVAERSSRSVYFVRDRKLVDMAAFCIAYCTKDTGGTAYTVKYAKRQGIEIINLAKQ